MLKILCLRQRKAATLLKLENSVRKMKSEEKAYERAGENRDGQKNKQVSKHACWLEVYAKEDDIQKCICSFIIYILLFHAGGNSCCRLIFMPFVDHY